MCIRDRASLTCLGLRLQHLSLSDSCFQNLFSNIAKLERLSELYLELDGNQNFYSIELDLTKFTLLRFLKLSFKKCISFEYEEFSKLLKTLELLHEKTKIGLNISGTILSYLIGRRTKLMFEQRDWELIL
eukprot:TRINITY_DN23142_c0_g1_i1.p1 TRINITY_DN23142_c0_g1~~TRINITY_DN23142_c0_g1_i1.p1  ORF type:complete len:130 (+),score=2.37 TRINITY_DN23142_c0_g1_i1:64-453(+)